MLFIMKYNLYLIVRVITLILQFMRKWKKIIVNASFSSFHARIFFSHIRNNNF